MICELHWASSHYIYLFPIILFAIGCMIYRVIRFNKSIDKLAGQWRDSLFVGVSRFKNTIKAALLVFGTLFLFVALLRPQGKEESEKVTQEGRDLFIALDISRSMLATDVLPNRLVCAKQKILEIVQALSCERVGLILFSGAACVQCPLTADFGAFSMFLEQIDAETISSGSTALDKAIAHALHAFKSMPDKKNKLLVLVTDGEDFSSNLASIKNDAQQQGMHIFALGVGSTQGAPVPLFDLHGKPKGHQKDRNGNVVISRLNEGILSALTQDVGGVYLRVTDDATDVKRLVGYVQQFEKEQFGEAQVAHFEVSLFFGRKYDLLFD